MVDAGGMVESIRPFVTTLVNSLIWVVLGFVAIGVAGTVAWFSHKKKKWNLRIEIKMPRSDNRITLSENAKGHFSAKEGIVTIKRKGVKGVLMRPFDVRKYLQGEKYLEVIQLAPEDYIPILPKSYQTLISNPSGNKVALLDVEADLGERKQWASHSEMAAIDRFTLSGFFDKHWRAIETSLLLFVMFLGFSILWMRVGG